MGVFVGLVRSGAARGMMVEGGERALGKALGIEMENKSSRMSVRVCGRAVS